MHLDLVADYFGRASHWKELCIVLPREAITRCTNVELFGLTHIRRKWQSKQHHWQLPIFVLCDTCWSGASQGPHGSPI